MFSHAKYTNLPYFCAIVWNDGRNKGRNACRVNVTLYRPSQRSSCTNITSPSIKWAILLGSQVKKKHNITIYSPNSNFRSVPESKQKCFPREISVLSCCVVMGQILQKYGHTWVNSCLFILSSLFGYWPFCAYTTQVGTHKNLCGILRILLKRIWTWSFVVFQVTVAVLQSECFRFDSSFLLSLVSEPLGKALAPSCLLLHVSQNCIQSVYHHNVTLCTRQQGLTNFGTVLKLWNEKTETERPFNVAQCQLAEFYI